jgi:hypothetical protein
MNQLPTTTTSKIPGGMIRARIYNESNQLVMLLIKPVGSTNYIKHVIQKS